MKSFFWKELGTFKLTEFLYLMHIACRKEELEPEEKEKMRKLQKRVGSLDYSITYDVITEELKFWYSEYIEFAFLRNNGTVKKVTLESFVFLWKPAHLEHLLQAYFWGLPACL